MSNTMATIHAVHSPTHQSQFENDHTSAPTTKPLADLPLAERPILDIPENTRCSDLPVAILEEGEESASEPLEPVTPTSETNNHALPSHPVVNSDPARHHTEEPIHDSKTVNTETTPPSSPLKTVPSTLRTPNAASTTRPSPLRSASKSIKSLFRRPSQHEAMGQPITGTTPPDGRNSSSISHRKNSIPTIERSSPPTSQSNSPPSPSSTSSTLHGVHNSMLSPSPPDDNFVPKRPNRSSTGLSLRNRSKVMFSSTPKPQRDAYRIRSPSLSDVRDQPQRPGFSIPAVSGAGLKARRMSASLPDDFFVDTCELGEEYASASRVPGKRGKEIGRGSTATVKIMCRKGSGKSKHYAVKEFRKRGQKETEEDYVKKVKSEFSIANSLHHPNIVETFRLCTQGSRWNHVMEYCSYGELFSLVQKKYLQPRDNLCFFKQVVRGVGHLHENGIAHRDIKLENLLLSDDGHVKITDFGVSEVFSGIHPGLRAAGGVCGKDMGDVRLCAPGICGSLPYIAPEVLAKEESYDPRRLDIWSCAIVYFTLHFRGHPWPTAETKHINYSKFVNGWNRFLQTHPDGLIVDSTVPSCGPLFKFLNNSGLKRLMLRMLNPDPAKRITIQGVLKDRYFKTIECCCADLEKDPSKVVKSIDAAGKGSVKLANKMVVQKIHNHFPPEKRYLPQHRFDMGEGY